MNLNTEMGLLFESEQAAAELEALYRRKTAPELAYRLALDGEGRLRWHDDAAQPPLAWDREPDAGFWRRLGAALVGWLPVESQL